MTLLSACANPAPIPPAPRVSGLNSYVSGAAAYQAGDTEKAQPLLEQAVNSNPNLVSAHQLLGDLYRKKQDFVRAGDQYAAFVRLDPYNFKSHYDFALACQLMDRLQEAAQAYLEALLLSPRDLNSNMNLGLVYLALGKTDDAVASLQLATEIDPHSAAAFCNLGVAQETAGQIRRAETAYRRAMELDPGMIVAMVDLGSNLVRQDRGEEATIVLQAAAKKTNTTLVHELLGNAMVLNHRDDDARKEYDAALRVDPRYWPAMNQIGLILMRKYQAGLTLDENLRRSAVALWQQSLSIHPGQAQIGVLVQQWNQSGQLTP